MSRRESFPSGPIEISQARISSAVGVLPTPYVGDCAFAIWLRPETSQAKRSLRQSIMHAPIAGHPPRKNRIVLARGTEIAVVWLIKYFAASARVGCTVPSSSVQRDMITRFCRPTSSGSQTAYEPWDRPGFEARRVSSSARRRSRFPRCESRRPRPSQSRDFVESGAGQLLLAGRKGDDRFRPNLASEGGDPRIVRICP